MRVARFVFAVCCVFTLGMAGTAAIWGQTPPGQLHVLLLGVDGTPDQAGTYATRLGQDARELGAALRQANVVDTRMLVDGDLKAGAGGSVGLVDAEFDRLQRVAGPQDTVMIVVATRLWADMTSADQTPGALFVELDTFGDDFRFAHLMVRIRRLPCANVVLVLPKLANTGIEAAMGRYVSAFPAGTGGTNLLLLTSTTLLPRSPERSALLPALGEALRGDADTNHDGIVNMEELSQFVLKKSMHSAPDAVARMEPGFRDEQSWDVNISQLSKGFDVVSRDVQARLAGEPAPAMTAAAGGDMDMRGASRNPPAKAAMPQVLPKTYAVLFATDHYAHWNALTNPIDDATALQAVLRDSYEVQTELVPDPTADDILITLRRYLARSYAENAQLIVFFAGHGYFDEELGMGFLAARDSELPAADATHRTMLSFDVLRTYIARIPAKHVLLVIDSCFAGTFDRKVADSGTRAVGNDTMYAPRPLAEVIRTQAAYPTRRYITSGGKEYVPDGRPGQHSPFTSALLQTLRRDADEHGYTRWRDLQEGLERVTPMPHWGSFEEQDDLNGDLILLTTPMRTKLLAAGADTAK